METYINLLNNVSAATAEAVFCMLFFCSYVLFAEHVSKSDPKPHEPEDVYLLTLLMYMCSQKSPVYTILGRLRVVELAHRKTSVNILLAVLAICVLCCLVCRTVMD